MNEDMEYTYEFLRKCFGLRFWATLNNKPQEGIIKVMSDCVMLCYGDKDYGRLFTFERRDTLSLSAKSFRMLPSDFEIVPRDPETYKDWLVGDKVESMLADPGGEVIFRSGRLVVLGSDDGWAREAFTCDELYENGYRLVLTDIEKQILEEQKWEPKDGDIVAWGKLEDKGRPAVTIYRKGLWGYFTLFANGTTTLDKEYDGTLVFDNMRPATDEEKQQLFDALAKAGKRWNKDEKRFEDIPAPHELMKGDLVLVRDAHYMGWKLRVFEGGSDAPELPYKATLDGFVHEYRYCIPYNEETKHLLGTTDDYEEGER